MKRARLSPSARSDLEEIAAYIGSDNPARAKSFIAELRAKCLAIARHPRLYPTRQDIGPDIRRALHGRYLILFRELPHEVRVERIIHSARDLTKTFKSKPESQ